MSIENKNNENVGKKRNDNKKAITIWVSNELIENTDEILPYLGDKSRTSFIIEAWFEHLISTKDRMIRADIIKRTRETEFDKKMKRRESKLKEIIAQYDEVIIIDGQETAVRYDTDTRTGKKYISDQFPVEAIKRSIAEGRI